MGVELRGLALEWLETFAGGGDDPERLAKRLAQALGLPWPADGGDLAVLMVAGDMGLAPARIVQLERVTMAGQDSEIGLARQWRFALKDEQAIEALILPVAMDDGRAFYAPGQVTLHLQRLGIQLFTDCICDLVAIPLAGGVPLSLTGLTLAVGRFAVRERGELEIFATGIAWLRAHLARAREMEAEMPAHLVRDQLDPADHFSTLILEPKAIEWRPLAVACAFPRGTKSLIVRDSLGLAGAIDTMMRRKDKAPPMPKVFGPKAGAA